MEEARAGVALAANWAAAGNYARLPAGRISNVMREINTMSSPFRSCLGIVIAGASFALLSASSAEAASGEQASQPQVTFTRDVAPILQKSCQNCHRPGAMAPMSLTTYEEVRPWVRSIKARVASREMPPWHIDRNIGLQKFKGDPSLTDKEIATMTSGTSGRRI
jgi:hypothetical protein